jgi:PPP family 3-phenylpropionic acid transporter
MRAYWVLASIIFLNFTAGGATSPFFGLYATSLGASLAQIAFVVGVQAFVAVVAGLVFGRITDRLGQRRLVIPIALASLAAMYFVIANVTYWTWLVPLHALLGVASGAENVTALALMGDVLHGHPHRGRLISGYRMSGSLAFSVAIVTSGWLSQTFGLRGCFLLAAGIYVIAFVVSLFITEPARQASSGASTGFSVLLRGPMRPLLIVALAFGVPFAAVFSVWPVWIADTLGYGRETFSQLWGIAAFVEVPSMFIAGLLVDRVGRRMTFVVGMAGFSLVYLLYVLAPPLPGLVLAQVLRGVTFAAFTATALTMAIELAPPEARGRASGLFTSAQRLAQISGNWIGGPLAATLGFRLLYALAAVTVLGGATYSYLVVGRSRAAEEPALATVPSATGTRTSLPR